MTPSYLAFGDELLKIAFFQKMRNGFADALNTGWNGYGPRGSATRQDWPGAGMMSEAERSAAKMGPISRGIDTATSLGGLTRKLPVGAKSMMALSTGLQLNGALQKQDPSGQGHSRAERLTGLAGNTVGGLAATGALLNRARASGKALGGGKMMALNLLGGIGGGMLGEKLVTAPWRNARNAQTQHMMNQYRMTPPQQNEVPA